MRKFQVGPLSLPVADLVLDDLRRLDPQQLAIAAEKLANLGKGGDRKSEGKIKVPKGTLIAGAEVTLDQAADMLNVSRRHVARVRRQEAHQGVSPRSGGVKGPPAAKGAVRAP